MDNASHTCWPGQRAPQLARATVLPRGVAPGRPPGGVGLGKGRGCPTRLSRSCAGCRLEAGIPGGGKGREDEEPPPQPRWESSAASRSSGSRESWRSREARGRIPSTSSPQRGLLAFLSARSSQPPARDPGPCGVRDNWRGLRQRSLELGCSSSGPWAPSSSDGSAPGQFRLKRVFQPLRTGATGSELL